MNLRDRLAEYRSYFEAVTAVATCRDSLMFLDLCWPPFDPESELRRTIENRYPGVILETATRVVVIEEHSGELRYYAGGWAPETRIVLEQDRIEAEGCERGIFPGSLDAVIFAECYLAEKHPLQNIRVPREVHHSRETNIP